MGRTATSTWGMRLLFAIIAISVCAAPVFAQGQAKASGTASTAASVGSWAAPVSFCPNGPPCVIGANAVVMHTGKVLFYYYPQGTSTGSAAMELDPTTGIITNVTLNLARDIFCSGVTVLPNGQVAVTGGVVEGTNHASHIDNDGTNSLTIFDPVSQTWTAGTDMSYPRWYPSSVELANGSFIELSGSDATGLVIQTVLESYKYTTGT
jgi:galactose oxidase